MKLLHLVFLVGFFSHTAHGVIDLEIRGPIANATPGLEYVCTSQDAPIFYYDMDTNFGTESINISVSDGSLIKRNDLYYRTSSCITHYKYYKWGSYESVGFQGEQYLVSYLYDQHGLCNENKYTKNIFQDRLISKILLDDNKSKSISDSTPLQLMEGYSISIVGEALSEHNLIIELRKNNNVIHSYNIKDDMTYIYSTGESSDVILIAIHFAKILVGDGKYYADIDGIWQISENPIDLTNIDSDRMSVNSINDNDKSIVMSNINDIDLKSGKRKKILWTLGKLPTDEELGIRIADQMNASNRFYIYKKFKEPGTYQIRGPVYEIRPGDISIDADSFAGFYYNLDEGINTESISLEMSVNKDLPRITDITYTTCSKKERFSYDNWGDFNVIGFMGRKYFASYNNDGNSIFCKSNDKNLLGDYQQLSEIIMDYDDSYSDQLALHERDELNLSEGYRVRINSIDVKGKKIKLDLYKDNDPIRSDVVIVPSDDAINATFIYSANLGKAGDIVLIAIHFDEVLKSHEEEAITTVDGIWQISEEAIDVGDNQKFGIMKTLSVDEKTNTIILKNDQEVVLKGNKDIMNNIYIKVSKNRTKFCICRDAVLEMHRTIVIERN